MEEIDGRSISMALFRISQHLTVSIDREHFNLELIYVEVARCLKLASMIVCNSENIREAPQDIHAILKHDFRFLDLYVIVEQFCALCNENPHEELTRVRSVNIELYEGIKYIYPLLSPSFSQILLSPGNIFAWIFRYRFYSISI